MIVSASAPCRLDFAGGWTDVEPYAGDHGGLVVNGAIELLASASVTIPFDHYHLESHDLGRTVTARDVAGLTGNDLALLTAAIRYAGIAPCQLTTRSDAPPGSGLGSSGAMDVALIAALDHARGRPVTAIETAERAWHLEVVEAGLPGGKQDQYASALGGFQVLRFAGSRVEATGLPLEPELVGWLERHTVVCYTGQSRVSGSTIARVMDRYRRGDPVVSGALDGLADTADRMAEALGRGHLSEIGRLLTVNWCHQRALDPGMSTPLMSQLDETMAGLGALGGKAAGAGAGGTMFFLVPDDPAGAAAAARALGVTILPLTWASKGVRLW